METEEYVAAVTDSESASESAQKPRRSARKRAATAKTTPAVSESTDAHTAESEQPADEARNAKADKALSAAPMKASRKRASRAQKPELQQLEAEPPVPSAPVSPAPLLFQAPDLSAIASALGPVRSVTEESDVVGEDDDQLPAESRKRRRRGGSRRGKDEVDAVEPNGQDAQDDEREQEDPAGQGSSSSGRRRRRRRGDAESELSDGGDDDRSNTVTRVRSQRSVSESGSERVSSVKGSTRLEAKKQRRRESRESGRRRHVITEAEFLARRESVDRVMAVRQRDDRIQIGVLEDGVLVEHFVSRTQQDSLIGNVYLGKVQNVLPSMEAAFVDIGRGRNAVLYAGEVNWSAAKLGGAPRRIENALKSGDSVLVQVAKDPVGHKGARLTSQISLPGRYLVYVPGGSMTGISRKLPDVERNRLKRILKDNLPEDAGVIVRTAAEGASEQELTNDINRLRAQWENIESRAQSPKARAPEMLYGEPDLTIKVVRDVFNEDFSRLIVSGEEVWDTIEAYVTYVAPDLLDRLEKWTGAEDIFTEYRITEQINKAMERKVFLPSGGSLIIERTEAMTVIDVNTGKFTGSGGNLEETVTKNNLEAAEEVVRQLRLRDIGGIIVVDFIDMVLESNRDLVLRRLVECLSRDRTKHQVAEVTSLGLVQMTRKRMGTGLLEVFGEQCEACSGLGVITHEEPVEHRHAPAVVAELHLPQGDAQRRKESRNEKRRNRQRKQNVAAESTPAATGVQSEDPEERAAKAEATRQALATIAAAAMTAHQHDESLGEEQTPQSAVAPAVDSSSGATEAELTANEDSQPVLTFGEETVELPRREDSSGAAGGPVAPELTLDRLNDVFDHIPSEDQMPQPKRARKRRAAGRAQSAPNTTQVQPSIAAEVASPQMPEPMIFGVGVPASEL